MSHVTDLRLRINDLDALEAACDVLGLELHRDQTTYAWWGRFVGDSRAYGEHQPVDMGTCEHAISIKGDLPKNGATGPWEIGVVKAKDGNGFGLYYDTFGGAGRRLTKAVGVNAYRLRQEYAVAVASAKATKVLAPKGFRLTRENVGGKVRLQLRRG